LRDGQTRGSPPAGARRWRYRQRVVDPGDGGAGRGRGRRRQQGGYHFADPLDRGRLRGGEHPRQRRVPGLGGHADVALGRRTLQGRAHGGGDRRLLGFDSSAGPGRHVRRGRRGHRLPRQRPGLVRHRRRLSRRRRRAGGQPGVANQLRGDGVGTGRYDIGTPEHERWLAAEADRLLEFYRAAADKSGGGFWWLDRQGNPQPEQGKQLWLNARMVHGFALGALSGRDDLRALVTHGVEFLAEGPLHDADHGGWMWSTDADGAVVDTSKQAYGHAFVLLASCSAQLAGVDASSLRDEVVSIIDQRYWREADGLCVDTYDRTWSDLERYRGQNANMHLVEAFLAAADVTGDPVFHQRATRIAKRLIDEFTRANDWRLAEHYDESWRIERDYNIDDKDHPFRPYGSIVGHWFEWARLLVQLHAARPASAAPDAWVLEAARALFARGIADG